MDATHSIKATRSGSAGREILGFAAGGGDEVDVAAGGALVAHEAADEGDLAAVGGPAGDGDLQAVEGAGDFGGVEDGFRLSCR